jgi:hypothetical protein
MKLFNPQTKKLIVLLQIKLKHQSKYLKYIINMLLG